MKRRLCGIAIALLLLLQLSALAEPSLDRQLLSVARSAVGYLSSGEYERLVTLLPFSGISPGASEWERFSRNYEDLSGGKASRAVAYWLNDHWNIAAPVGNSKEALILLSEDGSAFSGYRYATWSQIKREVERSGDVIIDD